MKETQLAIINNTISVSSIKTKLDLFLNYCRVCYN